MRRGGVEHPKVESLASDLGIGIAQAIGHLECLFHFTARYSRRGDIGRYPDQVIASRCHWPGDATLFVRALTAARWLDARPEARLVVHDWHEHCDDYTKKTLKQAGEVFASIPASVQIESRQSSENSRISSEQFSEGDGSLPEKLGLLTSLTLPTLPIHGQEDSVQTFGSQEFIESYPKKTGTQNGIQTYLSVVKSDEQREVFLGLERWKKSEAWQKDSGKFIPEPARWLTDRRWQEYPAPAQPIGGPVTPPFKESF